MTARTTRLPRMVACDLDGTLLRSDFTVSARTVALLDRLPSYGITFVVATGRSLGGWLPLVGRFPVNVPVVCANGALIVEPTGRAVIAECQIGSSVLTKAVAVVGRHDPGAVFAVENGFDLLHERDYPAPQWAPDRTIRAVNRVDLCSTGGHKLLIRSRHPRIQELVGHYLPGLALTYAGTPGLMEATPAAVSKATGVAWIARRLGISRDEVLAFGDMPNDLPLLRWAGTAVAVAGAHPEVLARVSACTAHCDADGVAAYLDLLLNDGDVR